MILFLSIAMDAASAQAPVSGNAFFFHLKSEVYRNENASVIVMEEANLSAPPGSTPRISELSASIRNATTIFGTIWVGTVAWVTQPLTYPTTFQGTALFTVWLSSDDVTPSFSGVGAGLAVLNQQNQTVGNYVYTFTYARGSVLNPTPTPYTFKIELNQEVFAGQRLIFAVGVGSTTEGWHMKVFFDDAQHPSRVQLPTILTVIPEFPLVNPILATFGAVILSLAISSRKICGRQMRNTGFCVFTRLRVFGRFGTHD